MNKHQERILVAALCGVIITAAAALAVQPAMAASYGVERPAQVSGVAHLEQLNVRKWPAAYSRKIGALSASSQVWVDRCIEVPRSADWCLVGRGSLKGWVNSRFLTLAGADWDI